MRTLVGIALLAALWVLTTQDLAGDTLFKKKAAVAIGFGETGKREVRWVNCSHRKGTTSRLTGWTKATIVG